MNLKYKILAVLAAGIALTACGGSGAPASAPASSVVPASSHVAEEGVTEPINLRTWTLDDLDDTQTTTFVSASITSGVQHALHGVNLKQVAHALHHTGQTLQTHAGIDVGACQTLVVALAVGIELTEHQIPDLHIAVAVAAHAAGRLPQPYSGPRSK